MLKVVYHTFEHCDWLCQVAIVVMSYYVELLGCWSKQILPWVLSVGNVSWQFWNGSCDFKSLVQLSKLVCSPYSCYFFEVSLAKVIVLLLFCLCWQIVFDSLFINVLINGLMLTGIMHHFVHTCLEILIVFTNQWIDDREENKSTKIELNI